ncbi:TetR/AcrR family transcriptional regulator [Tenacibaculum xiamenense]|uniref:TetR/AcrR family transcriptional regulator n=1 Tax=Tenacibaculum xiamenense TaxID=1261553 RepID=UPI003895DCCE
MKKAQRTRLSILNKAFELIYSNGYRATSIDEIIATTQVTKGAFYYHFKNKDEMGIAMINEVITPRLSKVFVKQLENEDNPLFSIYVLFQHLLMKDPFLKIELGCPASNLIQEMTPWNTSFSYALNKVVDQWLNSLITALERGRKNKTVNENVNTKSTAMFILSGYWGARNLGKLETTTAPYHIFLEQLKTYLKTLT